MPFIIRDIYLEIWVIRYTFFKIFASERFIRKKSCLSGFIRQIAFWSGIWSGLSPFISV